MLNMAPYLRFLSARNGEPDSLSSAHDGLTPLSGDEIEIVGGGSCDGWDAFVPGRCFLLPWPKITINEPAPKD